MTTITANDIISDETNAAVLIEFFKGVASCDYYDGSSYQLYFDKNDCSLFINHEASANAWLQRDDGSLVQICAVSGYSDTPADERYNDDCGLCDFGYAEWRDTIEQKITEVL